MGFAQSEKFTNLPRTSVLPTVPPSSGRDDRKNGDRDAAAKETNPQIPNTGRTLEAGNKKGRTP